MGASESNEFALDDGGDPRYVYRDPEEVDRYAGEGLPWNEARGEGAGVVKSIREFVAAIARPRLNGMFNPWGEACPTERSKNGFEVRQERLIQHLDCQPRLIGIGEACGYRGARYSGIAFTSERQIFDGAIPRAVGRERITNRDRPWSEPSATIVWKALKELGIAEDTVLFNAVPWHPMGPGGIHSNRTPTASEKDAGLPFLERFFALYQKNVVVVSIGQTAADALRRLHIEHQTVRHPANGGASLFRQQLANIVKPSGA